MCTISSFGGRKKEREIAEKTVAWCIKRLMPRMKTLDIIVEFKALDAYGYCMQETGRNYVLSINRNLPLLELVSTICHEMIHVKQYARNELRQVKGKTMWKTRNCSNVEYFDAPWEKEAFKRETGLAFECMLTLDVLA